MNKTIEIKKELIKTYRIAYDVALSELKFERERSKKLIEELKKYKDSEEFLKNDLKNINERYNTGL